MDMLYFFLFLMLKFNINRMDKHEFLLFEHCLLNDLKISSCVLYDGNIMSFLGMLNINREKMTNHFFFFILSYELSSLLITYFPAALEMYILKYFLVNIGEMQHKFLVLCVVGISDLWCLLHCGLAVMLDYTEVQRSLHE